MVIGSFSQQTFQWVTTGKVLLITLPQALFYPSMMSQIRIQLLYVSKSKLLRYVVVVGPDHELLMKISIQ